MAESTGTEYNKKCEILGRLWIEYSTDLEMQDFIEYNDLGLPIAYALSEQIVQSTTLAEAYVNETWDLLLTALKVDDIGFNTLQDVFAASEIG